MKDSLNEYLDILVEKGKQGMTSLEFSVPAGVPLDEMVSGLLKAEEAMKTATPLYFDEENMNKDGHNQDIISSDFVEHLMDMLRQNGNQSLRVVLRPQDGKAAMFHALCAACAERDDILRPH